MMYPEMKTPREAVKTSGVAVHGLMCRGWKRINLLTGETKNPERLPDRYLFPRPFDLFPAINPQPLEPSRNPKSYQPPVLLTA